MIHPTREPFCIKFTTGLVCGIMYIFTKQNKLDGCLTNANLRPGMQSEFLAWLRWTTIESGEPGFAGLGLRRRWAMKAADILQG